MSNIEQELSKLSINERQCIAVICFERFCKKYNITHKEITIFIEHIWKVSDIQGKEKLVDWMEEFSQLSITGLGDKIPDDIMNVISEDLKADFCLLTYLVVDTSAGSWYAAESPNSTKMVLRIFDILKKHNITVPEVSNYNTGTTKSVDGWILKIKDEKIKKWRLDV